MSGYGLPSVRALPPLSPSLAQGEIDPPARTPARPALTETEGLKVMTRNHIHCAIGLAGESGVVSGMFLPCTYAFLPTEAGAC